MNTANKIKKKQERKNSCNTATTFLNARIQINTFFLTFSSARRKNSD